MKLILVLLLAVTIAAQASAASPRLRHRELSAACSGDPCADLTHCRSQHGFCGLGAAWCNPDSIWTASCSAAGSTVAPTSATTCSALACPSSAECRSQAGECGQGPEFCNDASTWALQGCCPVRRRLASPCAGEACANPEQCRSQWGHCGTGPSWCNADSIWVAGCAQAGPTDAPSSATGTATPSASTDAPTTASDTAFPFVCPSPTSTPSAATTKTPTKAPVVSTPPPTSAATTKTPTKTPVVSTTTPPPTSTASTTTPPPTSTATTNAPVVSTTTPPPTTSTPSPSTASTTKKEIGLYFAEWGIYGRNYLVKNLDTSGQARQLTFVNYAFANIYAKPDGTYVCDASVTKAESGAGDGGDAYAAYGKGFGAGDAVDGVADAWDFAWDDPRVGESPRTAYPLKGNFNQLRKLKAKHPNLRVLMSIGGWSWSKWFSAASATDALRKTLVRSCVDQYILGNLPLDHANSAGGAGTASHVFDGLDLDWEYPGLQGVGYNTLDLAQDGANQVLLFEEFRAQLDAVRPGLLLTTAIGAGQKHLSKTDPVAYAAHADWINIMSYDYHGGWAAQGPTDFQSNLHADPASPNHAAFPDFNTDTSVRSLLALGVPAHKLQIGVPLYGRGWTGVAPGPNGDGLYQAATGPAAGTYEAGIEDYKVLRSKGTQYTHPITGQSYSYDGTTWWSFDTPAVVQAKAAYANALGLGGIFGWEADGDYGSELTDAMASINHA